jgi:hypothetical protein
MTDIIGAGAYGSDGHRNKQFLKATEVGPYPMGIPNSWTKTREEATNNYGIEGSAEWDKLGPLAEPTPASARNKGAVERKN